MFRIPLYQLQIVDIQDGETRILYTELSWEEVVTNWLGLRKEGYRVYIVRDKCR